MLLFLVQDGYWSVWHYSLTSFSPLPISLLLLIAVKGWKGFSVFVGPLPLPVLLILIGQEYIIALRVMSIIEAHMAS